MTHFGQSSSVDVLLLTLFKLVPFLQVGSFVQLRGVDCHLLPGGCRKLILVVAEDDEYVKVLGDDDPQLLSLKR